MPKGVIAGTVIRAFAIGGLSHGVALPSEELFFAEVHLLGGPAPVRRFLPELVDLIWSRRIDPGRVFDLTLTLDQMDERRGIKALMMPSGA